MNEGGYKTYSMMNNLAETFKSTFDPYFNAPLEIWKTFENSGEVVQTQKNEVIKKYGETFP